MSDETFPCYVCKVRQPRENFYISKRITGVGSSCKPCTRQIRKDKYAANKGDCTNYHKLWLAKNREHYNEYMRRWNAENRFRERANGRTFQAAAKPKWANQFFIKEIYRLSKLRSQTTGLRWNVDHIVPLRHPLVCGLHVEHNLQVTSERYNKFKGNRFWPDMPEGSFK